jgi:hypothetical protein
VDHFASDRDYHTYCGTCFDQIPDWLIRWSGKATGRLFCEGCERMARVSE